MQIYFIELSYLLASILFILGLKGMSHPETAKRGMHLAEFGMLMAIIGTLMHHEIITYTWILIGLAVGSVIFNMRSVITKPPTTLIVAQTTAINPSHVLTGL